MKQKVFKRNTCVLTVLLLFLTITFTSFAKETSEVDFPDSNNIVIGEDSLVLSNVEAGTIEKDNLGVVLDSNKNWDTGEILPNSYIDLNIKLDSYWGQNLNRKIIVNATSDSTSGALFLYLYKPNGELASHDWIMGINEVVEWSLFWPTSGNWRLRVMAQGTNEPVYVWASWQPSESNKDN